MKDGEDSCMKRSPAWKEVVGHVFKECVALKERKNDGDYKREGFLTKLEWKKDLFSHNPPTLPSPLLTPSLYPGALYRVEEER